MNSRRALILDLCVCFALGALLMFLVCALVAGASTMSENRPPAGVDGRTLPVSRQGVSASVLAEVVGIYGDAAKDINAALARSVAQLAENPERRSAQFQRARASQLLNQVQSRLLALDRDAALAVKRGVGQAVNLGLVDAAAQMRKIGFGPRASGDALAGSFANIDARLTETIARDTAAKMRAGIIQHGERAESLFRTLSAGPLSNAEPEVNRAIARGLLTGDPRVADGALRDLFRDPNAPELESYRKLGNQVIEVGGWTGSVRTYAATVMRTRTREASTAARHEQLLEVGLDLVQITGRVSENFCTRYLGLVCSLGAARDGYPSIRDLPGAGGGGPPFHPNCSKGTVVFVLDLASDARRAAADNALRAYRANAA